jgi:hypothetical protein
MLSESQLINIYQKLPQELQSQILQKFDDSTVIQFYRLTYFHVSILQSLIKTIMRDRFGNIYQIIDRIGGDARVWYRANDSKMLRPLPFPLDPSIISTYCEIDNRSDTMQRYCAERHQRDRIAIRLFSNISNIREVLRERCNEGLSTYNTISNIPKALLAHGDLEISMQRILRRASNVRLTLSFPIAPEKGKDKVIMDFQDWTKEFGLSFNYDDNLEQRMAKSLHQTSSTFSYKG